jgi:hypothetical protein
MEGTEEGNAVWSDSGLLLRRGLMDRSPSCSRSEVY